MGKGTLCALLTSAAMAVALVLLSGGTASADPGTCGVRHGADASPTWTYIVRNRCTTGYSFKVRAHGKWTGCKHINGAGFGYFHVNIQYTYDPDWIVRVC